MSILRLLYQPYKYLIYIPAMAVFTVILALLCVLVCLVINQSVGSRYVARPWAKLLFSMTPAKVEVIGGENLDSDCSYVVIANHMSMFDILVLYGWLDLDLKWVMKKELRRVPFLGGACAAMGHIFIDRKNRQAAAAALEKIKSSFVHGVSVLFFPEGTRSDNGSLKRFKRGAFMTAQDLELPILPITIVGTNKILPNGTIDLYPGTAKMIIHEPISLEQVKSLSQEELTQLAHDRVGAAL